MLKSSIYEKSIPIKKVNNNFNLYKNTKSKGSCDYSTSMNQISNAYVSTVGSNNNQYKSSQDKDKIVKNNYSAMTTQRNYLKSGLSNKGSSRNECSMTKGNLSVFKSSKASNFGLEKVSPIKNIQNIKSNIVVTKIDKSDKYKTNNASLISKYNSGNMVKSKNINSFKSSIINNNVNVTKRGNSTGNGMNTSTNTNILSGNGPGTGNSNLGTGTTKDSNIMNENATKLMGYGVNSSKIFKEKEKKSTFVFPKNMEFLNKQDEGTNHIELFENVSQESFNDKRNITGTGFGSGTFKESVNGNFKGYAMNNNNNEIISKEPSDIINMHKVNSLKNSFIQNSSYLKNSAKNTKNTSSNKIKSISMNYNNSLFKDDIEVNPLDSTNYKNNLKNDNIINKYEETKYIPKTKLIKGSMNTNVDSNALLEHLNTGKSNTSISININNFNQKNYHGGISSINNVLTRNISELEIDCPEQQHFFNVALSRRNRILAKQFENESDDKGADVETIN